MRIEDLIGKGLPEFAVPELASRGIADLEPLQEEAVKAGLLEGKNIVVMAPTSSGKTLIGELAALFHAVNRGGTIYITSHKALAYEKYLMLRESYARKGELKVHIGIATGDEVTDEGSASGVSIDIATYEKWYYMLINRPELIATKSLIIIDEIQHVGDEFRGALLESLITWVRTKAPKTQIIGLSATVPNIEEVGRWLNAEVIVGERRPVPLREEIWSSNLVISFKRETDSVPQEENIEIEDLDTVNVLQEIEENDGLPTVVFCVTKPRTEDLAKQASLRRQHKGEAELLVNELDEVAEGNPTVRALKRVLPTGIAFHNANLLYNERRLIEQAYRDGKLDLIFATPTLMAGVNLPIKTVLFDSCYRDWVHSYISKAEYINMAGRAGRRGLQEEGRSVLVARSGIELERFKKYLLEPPEAIDSKLVGIYLERVVLQAIASGIAHREKEIEDFFQNSFHGLKASSETLYPKEEVRECLETLKRNGMVTFDENTFQATALGRETAAAGVSSRTGRLLFEKLEQPSRIFTWRRSKAFEMPVLMLAMASPDLAPSLIENALLFVHRTDNIAEIVDQKDKFIKFISQDEIEDFRRSLLSSAVAYRYINVASFTELRNMAYYANNAAVMRIAGYCAWMIRAAAAIEGSRGQKSNRDFQKWLLQIAKRLEFGIRAEGVELAAIGRFGDVKGLGRGRIEALVKNGLGNLSKLLMTPVEKLGGILQSTLRASRLREAVVGYLDEPSEANRISHENRACKCERSSHLIANFYESRGTRFNKAALDLLKTVYPKAREQDDGSKSEPDLAIPLKQGLLVIECKTKKSSEGTIGIDDAFAVIHKSAHLRPLSGRVTLGMPKFDQGPIERAANEGICLITHTIFCEAIIRIWEGKLKPESFIGGLQEAGLFDKNDLESLSEKKQ